MKRKLFTLFLAASLIVATAASPLHADTASAKSATKHADTTDTCTVHYKTLQEGGLLSYQHSNGKKTARKTATVSAKTQYALEAMLADTLDSFQDTCDFSALQLNTSTFCDLFYSYLDQHPRYFYVSGKISYYYDSNRIITKVRFNYKYSKTEAQSMLSAYDAAVNQALSGVNPLWSDMEKALYLNDGKKLQEFLRKYMITCISCFDGAAEGLYHGMMLGLAAGMSSRYYIRSNRESGEGRFDLVLEPKVHSLPGVIMEFKATKNDAGLSASADEALKQIEDKHYDTDMKDRGIKEIVKYGIAFAGKNVEIANG